MRCTRCDRPAVPQAIGVTPAGLFVFGWCVPCLDATGLPADRGRRAVARVPTRLILESSISWTSLRTRRRPDPLSDRRRLAGAVSLVLSLWGLLLFSVGLSLRFRLAPAGPRAESVRVPRRGSFAVDRRRRGDGGGRVPALVVELGPVSVCARLCAPRDSGPRLPRGDGYASLGDRLTLPAPRPARGRDRLGRAGGLRRGALDRGAQVRGLAAWGPDFQ